MARAAGERARARGFSMAQAKTKTAAAPRVNAHAAGRLMAPRGISRFRVRGLSASSRWSAIRLKAMAAERAPTMATTTQSQTMGPGQKPIRWMAKSTPESAKGRAKTEWEKRTMCPKVSTRSAIPPPEVVSMVPTRGPPPPPGGRSACPGEPG